MSKVLEKGFAHSFVGVREEKDSGIVTSSEDDMCLIEEEDVDEIDEVERSPVRAV